MCVYFLQNNIIIFIISIILCTTSFLFAQESSSGPANRGYLEYQKGPSAEDLSGLQKQARLYRNQGLQLQSIGNLDAAMTLYQKAIELDPAYAVAYNDLGVIYEAKGFSERAEESYLKSIKIDPNYLSAYSNLALFYENKRNLDKAVFYWQKRAQLGSPDDPWTEKAKQRSEDIHLVLGNKAADSFREQEVMGLIRDVANQKSILREDNKAMAREYFDKAKRSYDRGNYPAARKEALDAQQLDPANREIEKFIERVQIRALSR